MVRAEARELRDRADTLVFGRRTWEDLADYWPAAEQDPEDDAELEVARYMNETRKVVFSRALDAAETWANSELAAGEPAEILPGLQEESGRAIAVLGSPDLAASLMRDDLIDEYCLLILPKLFGGGNRLFPDGRPGASLRLLHQRALDTGAVFLRYGRG